MGGWYPAITRTSPMCFKISIEAYLVNIAGCHILHPTVYLAVHGGRFDEVPGGKIFSIENKMGYSTKMFFLYKIPLIAEQIIVDFLVCR